MNKKHAWVIIGIVVIAAAVAFISMRRAHMHAAMSGAAVGNLHAVNAEGTPMPALAAGLPEHSAGQAAEGLVVTFALDPYPPTMTEASTFKVTLTDVDGRPVSGAAIILDMTMPGMWMPTNQPKLTEGEAGIYSGTGQFTMRGLWRIEVIITLDDKTRSVFFDLGL